VPAPPEKLTPSEVMEMAPSGDPPEPTVLAKLVVPLPVEVVSVRAVASLESAAPNATLLFVVFSVVFPTSCAVPL